MLLGRQLAQPKEGLFQQQARVEVEVLGEGGAGGLDATRQILAGSNPVVVLLLSTYEEEEYAPRAAECGAAAYIPKSAFGPDRLEAAWEAAAPTAGETG